MASLTNKKNLQTINLKNHIYKKAVLTFIKTADNTFESLIYKERNNIFFTTFIYNCSCVDIRRIT